MDDVDYDGESLATDTDDTMAVVEVVVGVGVSAVEVGTCSKRVVDTDNHMTWHLDTGHTVAVELVGQEEAVAAAAEDSTCHDVVVAVVAVGRNDASCCPPWNNHLVVLVGVVQAVVTRMRTSSLYHWWIMEAVVVLFRPPLMFDLLWL